MALTPTKRITGAPGVIEQRIRFDWDPRTGWITTRRWVGQLSGLMSYFQQLQVGGWSFSCEEHEGQNYMLTARIGTSWSNSGLLDNPVDVWELTSNKTEKDLLASNNPIINTLTGPDGTSPGDVAVIQALLLNPPDNTPTMGTPGIDPAQLSANGLIVYNLMVAGVTSDIVFAPVVRHTQTVSSIYAVQAALTGVGSIFLSATLNSLIPPGIAIALPPDGSITSSSGIVFNFGWLKDYPNVTVSAFNKSQIAQDWVFGLWPQPLKGDPL